MKIPEGIIPAMVTPLTEDKALNVSALRKLTHYLVEGGVHGLFTTGSQGEFWALSAEEKRRVWETVVEEAKNNLPLSKPLERGRNDKVPVYAGTAATSTRETVALTQLAHKAGVDAVSVLTPFFVAPNEDELYDHYRAVAEATDLPVLLYSNPGRTGVKLSPDLLARLSEIENIVGIKDSSGDLQLTAAYIRATPPDFAVLMGRDSLILAGLLYGARGAIAATANVVPALVARIYDCFKAGDLEGAKQAQDSLMPLRLAFSWGTFPVVVKEALDLMGLEAGPARGPVGPMSQERRAQLLTVLRDLGVADI